MGWSDTYKKSINCNNPKGFSQKAHCAGKKKRNKNEMKLSEFKEAVIKVLRERSINAISKLQQKNIEDVQRTLDLYKKVKSKGDDKQIKKYIDILKKLGKEKQKLAKELDDKVSGMYKNADYKGPIDEDSMDWEKNFKWANDKELKVISKFIFMNPKGIDGVIKMSKHKPSDFKKTIQKAAKAGLYKESINEGPSSEEKRIAMLAVRKQAKYRNVDLASAIQDQINALKELQRDVKRGKVK